MAAFLARNAEIGNFILEKPGLLQRCLLYTSILNIKCDPLVLGGLIDYQRYFPAYHMNKEKWVSAILNGTIPQEELFSLLRQS